MQCDPIGFPRVMFYDAYPTEIIQVPGRIIEFFDYFYVHRTIWMDGRELPRDPDPTWYGVSVGKWEGDTLVVETVGFNDRTWIDDDGHPHSEDMRVEERYHRIDHDNMELNMTIIDPKAYTQPWVGETKTWKLDPKLELREDVCVPSDEEKYKEEMRVPAATPPGKSGKTSLFEGMGVWSLFSILTFSVPGWDVVGCHPKLAAGYHPSFLTVHNTERDEKTDRS